MIFADSFEDMAVLAAWLTDDEDARREQEERAFRFYHDVVARDLAGLRTATDALLRLI